MQLPPMRTPLFSNAACCATAPAVRTSARVIAAASSASVWSARLAADGMTLAASVRCSVMANAAEWHVLAPAAQRRAKAPSVEQVALARTVRETAMVRRVHFTRDFFRHTRTSLAIFRLFVAPLAMRILSAHDNLASEVLYPCALFLF
jgi:hypothetical protein